MGLLYYFETTIDFHGEHSHNVFRKWLNLAEEFIAYPSKTTGVEIKQFWKVVNKNAEFRQPRNFIACRSSENLYIAENQNNF